MKIIYLVEIEEISTRAKKLPEWGCRRGSWRLLLITNDQGHGNKRQIVADAFCGGYLIRQHKLGKLYIADLSIREKEHLPPS